MVNDDSTNENNETFSVDLSSAVNATIADATGVVTIIDNNDPPPSMSIDDVRVTEGNNNTKSVTFTVRLSAASGRTVTVNYATANGTAMAGSDYLAKSGTVNIAAGATSGTFTVEVVGDRVREPTENFVVNLSGAMNATIVDSQAVCTIIDND